MVINITPKLSPRGVAEQFNTLLTRLRFEMELPNEENFTEEMEKQVIEVKNKCNFFPQFIRRNIKPENTIKH